MESGRFITRLVLIQLARELQILDRMAITSSASRHPQVATAEAVDLVKNPELSPRRRSLYCDCSSPFGYRFRAIDVSGPCDRWLFDGILFLKKLVESWLSLIPTRQYDALLRELRNSPGIFPTSLHGLHESVLIAARMRLGPEQVRTRRVDSIGHLFHSISSPVVLDFRFLASMTGRSLVQPHCPSRVLLDLDGLAIGQ